MDTLDAILGALGLACWTFCIAGGVAMKLDKPAVAFGLFAGALALVALALRWSVA